jgi:RAB protein geranylgeranyltransferase component A
MKFLKFVLDYDSESNAEVWQSHADEPLTTFLASQFHLDTELQAYVLTLTLSFDRQVGTRDGLAAINRHLTSMGVFGPGFAAVYPKWGGLSEVAQVACRAGAVGGGIYMLGTGIEKAVDQSENGEPVEVVLSSGTTIKTHLLVRGAENQPAAGAEETSRLVAVVSSPLRSLFEVLVEGAPAPAVAVIAFPPGSVTTKDGNASEQPIYVYAHSSDTGECPVGQSVLYFTTPSSASAKALLGAALESLLAALESPQCLYQLYYQQSRGPTSIQTNGKIVQLPTPSLSLAFDDSTLESVHHAWKTAMGISEEDTGEDYMVFPDREGAEAYDDDDE